MDAKQAEAHWKYTENVILLMLELAHRLYVEAMLHGAKHYESKSKE